MNKRKDGKLEVKEDFCKEALGDIDSYQTNIMNLESELKTIILGVDLFLYRCTMELRS
jgi:hypothetical protein